MTTQLTGKEIDDILASRGLPADWEILRDGVRIGHVECPDDTTASILATYRYGVGVSVRRKGDKP